MMNNSFWGVALLLFSVFIASCSQILLKIAANRSYANRIKEYLNPYVIVAYILFVGSSFLTMLSLKNVPIAFAPILEAAGYIFVGLLGWMILKEKATKKKRIGMIIIVLGIVTFSL